MIFNKIYPTVSTSTSVQEIITDANIAIHQYEREHNLGTGESNCRRACLPPQLIGPWGCIHDDIGLPVAAAGHITSLDFMKPFGSIFSKDYGDAYERAVAFLLANSSVLAVTVALNTFNLEAVLLKFSTDDGLNYVVSRIVWTNGFNKLLDACDLIEKAA